MVVLCATIVTKAGRPVLSRQFMSLSRVRVEALVTAFPKLLGSESQHTFIETDAVRYVYQPVEQLYMVLVTNKNSNIMEDLETLRQFVKLIPDYCQGHSEEAVRKHAFELCCAFDEVINLGYKESVTLQQIKTYTDMDSHEEKLQKIITESKISEAREAARKKAESIDMQKAAIKKAAETRGGRYSSLSSDFRGSSGSPRAGEFETVEAPKFSQPKPATKFGAFDQKEAAKAANQPSRGMQLGKAKPTDDFASAVLREEHLPAVTPAAMMGGAGSLAAAQAAQAPIEKDKVQVRIEEKIILHLERDGGIKKMEIKGEMKLCIFDPYQSRISVRTSGTFKKEDGFIGRLHPKIDKASWEKDGILARKDASLAFPVGAENAPVILKWRKVTVEDSDVPFTINFWPNNEDGRTVVNAEVTHVKKGIDFKHVYISVPVKLSEEPKVVSVDGDVKYTRADGLMWRIEEVSENNPSATLEFSIPEVPADDLFPLHVSFFSNQSYSNLSAVEVFDTQSSNAVDFHQEVTLTAEEFLVE